MLSTHHSIQRIPTSLYKIRSHIWIKDLLLNWVLIIAVCVIYGLVDRWFLFPFCGLIIGARLHALALLGHDASHRIALRKRARNDAVAEVLIAWPLFSVMKCGYRPWHFQHHRTLGSEVDPELSYRQRSPYRGLATWKKIALVFVLDMIGLGVFDLLHFMKQIFPYKERRQFLGPVLCWGAFLAACVYFGAWWLFALWTYSFVAGFWAVFRIRTWTEHLGIAPHGKETTHRFTTGALGRFFFFPHNTFCHYEHHKWPQVPYYNLPAIRKLDTSRPVVPVSALFPRRC